VGDDRRCNATGSLHERNLSISELVWACQAGKLQHDQAMMLKASWTSKNLIFLGERDRCQDHGRCPLGRGLSSLNGFFAGKADFVGD